MPNLVLLGIQGSGKGTQAYYLQENCGFKHINVGSLLREQIKKETDIGADVKDYILRGDLVPDEYIFTLIEPIVNSKSHGIVFDGFPRTVRQAEFLSNKIDVKYAIYFELDDSVAKERINQRRICKKCNENYNLLLDDNMEDYKCGKCGSTIESRDDDNLKAINRRIEAFHRATKPVIDFYRKKGNLLTIPATDKPEVIHDKLISLLDLQNNRAESSY